MSSSILCCTVVTPAGFHDLIVMPDAEMHQCTKCQPRYFDEIVFSHANSHILKWTALSHLRFAKEMSIVQSSWREHTV